MNLARIQTFSLQQCVCLCVCVHTHTHAHGCMHKRNMGLGCEELYKPGSYVIALNFNTRFCPNCEAICLSAKFLKYHKNPAILQLLLDKFSSTWRFLHRLTSICGGSSSVRLGFLWVGLGCGDVLSQHHLVGRGV